MSFTITTDVFCDKCNDWTSGVSRARVDKRGALQRAIRYGWTMVAGKHLCPICNGKASLRLGSGEYIWKEEKCK